MSLAPFGLFPSEALMFQPLATLALFFVALGFDLEGAFVEGREWDLGFDSLLALDEPAFALF